MLVMISCGSSPLRGRCFWAAWPFLLTAALLPFRVDGPINPHDEGVWLAAVQGLLEGRRLYRDIWFQYAPLLALPLELVCRIATPTLDLVRAAVWAMNLAGLLTVYACLLRWVKSPWARLVFSLLLFMVPSASHAPCLPMSARYGIAFLPLLFWPKDGRGHAALAGLASGLVFWTSQETFPAVLLGGGLWVSRTCGWKGLRDFGAGLALLFGAGWVLIAAYCGVGAYAECTLIGIARLVAAESLPFPTFHPELWSMAWRQQVPWLAAWQSLSDFLAARAPLACYIAALAAAWRLGSGNARRRWEMSAAALFGLMMLSPAWGRSDRWHIYIAISPLFFLCGLAADWEEEARPGRTPRLLPALGLLGALLTVPHALARAQKDRSSARIERRTSLVPRLGSARLPAPQSYAYEALVEWVEGHTRPGEPVLYYPYNGAFYFLADRPNPSRFPILAYAVHRAQQEAVVLELEAGRFDWVVLDRENTGFDGKTIAEFLGPIDAYIHSRFVATQSRGPLVFLRRRR